MSEHYYDREGNPHHFVEKKDKSGLRPSTLADCKKNGWLPSVTTVLRALDKPALTTWLIRNAVTAALTTPRLPNEPEDAFMERILAHDAEDEAAKARDRGTQIHDALELYLGGQPARVAPDLLPWIEPAAKFVLELGEVEATEKIVVGDGYAGKLDLCVKHAVDGRIIVDFKTTKKLPAKAAWNEHVLQGAFYAKAYPEEVISTGNLYISTIEQGKFAFFMHINPWKVTFSDACEPLLRLWQWMNDYRPTLEKVEL